MQRITQTAKDRVQKRDWLTVIVKYDPEMKYLDVIVDCF